MSTARLEQSDFSVFATMMKTPDYPALQAEMFAATRAEPVDVKEYRDLVYLHWSATTFGEAKNIVDALGGVASRSEVVLLQIISRVHGVEYITLKDLRRQRRVAAAPDRTGKATATATQ